MGDLRAKGRTSRYDPSGTGQGPAEIGGPLALLGYRKKGGENVLEIAQAVVPLPLPDLGQILAVLGNILLVLHQLVLELLDQEGAPVAQLLGQQVDDIHGQLSSGWIAQHAHVEGGGDGALFRAAAQGKRVVSVTKK